MSDRCKLCAQEKGQVYDWPGEPAWCSRHVLQIVDSGKGQRLNDDR